MTRRSANILKKVLVVLPVLIVLFLGGNWLFQDPEHLRARRRACRPIARELSREMQQDVRFTNVNVRVFEEGDKGPLFIIGAVGSQADLDELHRMLDSLHPPPASQDWNVEIFTNENARTN